MVSNYSSRPAWVEVNLDAIAANIKMFIELAGSKTELMAVVKADGYGHGAAAVASTALEAGAGSLAVAFVEEGIALRRSGIRAPILLLGYTDPSRYTDLVEFNLTPTIFNIDTAACFSALAAAAGALLNVHLKVDTGMGRVGFLPTEAVAMVSSIARMPGLAAEGLFTHFAAAEDLDGAYTRQQLQLFDKIIEQCGREGIEFKKIHAANSAAAINYPRSYYNMLRLGLAMYGHYPDPGMGEADDMPGLKPAMTFKSRVVMIKQVPPGSSISYGCTYTTTSPALIATVPVGYADGYSRLLSNRGQVLIRGCRVPVVGRICMDHLMVDVTGLPGVSLNDEVVLYGRQGEETVTVEEMAAQIGTVNYELLCAIDKRVPRYYFRDGFLHGIYDYFETVDLSAGPLTLFND